MQDNVGLRCAVGAQCDVARVAGLCLIMVAMLFPAISGLSSVKKPRVFSAVFMYGSKSPTGQTPGSLGGARLLVLDRNPQARKARTPTAVAHHEHSNSTERRVVVTGMGVVSTLGTDVDTFYGNLLQGVSGVSEIEGFDTSEHPTRFAGQIKGFHGEGYINRKMERRLDDYIKYILVAGKKALHHSGIAWDGPELKDLDPSRCGILVGSAMGGMTTFSTAIEALTQQGYRKMNPFCIPFAISNMGGAMLAMELGFMGPNYAISTACATGNYCLLSASEHIRRGDADLMLAGGSDAAVSPSGMAGFSACKALSKRNNDPKAASRPWDKGRDGFVMGEGSGVLVLEELEHARARGAPILAEFLGGAMTCDAHHMTEPDPRGSGVERCIRTALENAGVEPSRVSYVNAHATSTLAGDMVEYGAIRAALPHPSLRMNSTKSMIGHLLGAAGAVEAVVTVQAINTGLLHPNVNIDHLEDCVDPLVLVGPVAEQAKLDVALSNSFGFGGHNSCILMTQCKG